MKAIPRLTFAMIGAAGLAGCLTVDTGHDTIRVGLESHIDYLASDSLEGRLVGTPGIEKAGDYIAAEFERIGLEPAFDGSYFQDFEIELGFELEGEPVLRIGAKDLEYQKDFSVLPFSGSGSFPEGSAYHPAGNYPPGRRGWIAVALTDPETEEERWTMTGRDGLLEWMRDACGLATQWGADAMVFVSGRHDEPEASLHRFRLSRTHRPVDIPAVELRYDALNRVLADQGLSLGRITVIPLEGIRALDIPPLLQWSLEVSAVPGTVRVRNAGGILRGRSPEYLVIGAHYDHLGYGDIGSSQPWRWEIHPGADDNASGVAGIIEIGRLLSSYGAPERSLVFLAFTAEELGALGSEHYCKDPPYPIDSTVAMINLDTVGRLEDRELIVFGARSAEEFSGLLAEAGEGHDLEIIEKEEIYGFSDQNPFYARGVPSVHLFTGAHDDYHSPDDVADKINLDGLATVAAFAADFAGLVAFSRTALTPVVIEPETGETIPHGRGAHLGIVPDFTYTGTGVGIKGTVPGSPAEEAGLAGGDVLVGIDNQPLAGLKGLMRFLAESSPGDTVEMQVMGGSTVESVSAVLSVRSPKSHSD